MPDTKILERLSSDNARMVDVGIRLDLLRDLFPIAQSKISLTNDGFIYCETVKAKTVYQDADTTVMVWNMENPGDGFEVHEHGGSNEYAVVTSGEVDITINGSLTHYKKGECASIPRGAGHACKAVVSGSSVVGVCVPPEKAYIVESLLCPIFKESS